MSDDLIIIIAKVVDRKTGKEKFTSISSKGIPDYEDFDKLGFRAAFHEYEGAVLEAREKATIQLSEQFLNEGTKIKIEDAESRLTPEGGKVIEGRYSMKTKIGSLEPISRRLIAQEKTLYDTAVDFFEKIGARESWYSSRYEKLLLLAGTRLSMRESSSFVEESLGHDNSVIPTTARNRIERHGAEIAANVSDMAKEALNQEDVKAALERDQPDDSLSEPRFFEDPASVKTAAEKLGIENYDPADYEVQDACANISVDDVCVKAQKIMRPMPDGQEKKKRVENSVAHFENKDGKYAFNGDGIANVLRLVMGFMAFNNYLLIQPLVFFTDGAKNIHEEIKRTCKFTRFKIILDYYHLSKKFKELFSMAFNGKKSSKKNHTAIMKLLWVGDVDGAIAFMANVDPSTVRNQTFLNQLTDYLNRVRDYIPNYALRKELGLRNGSGIVEKTNDLLVAIRQKHNGMSWSKTGSLSLATVTCARVNGSLEDWTQKRVIPFKPIPKLAKAA